MTDNLRLDPAPAIVRQAFWLAAIGFLLVLAKTAATGTLVAGFGRTYAAGAGEAWTPGFDLIADEIRWRLVTALGVGVVLTLMVGVAAMAVGRRGDSSRTLVGFLALVAAAVLVLGVTFSPESAIAADDAASLAYYETLVPAWFQTLSAVTVLGVVVLFGIAFLRMGRAAAADYYQDFDPAARWRGFGSWLDFLRRRDHPPAHPGPPPGTTILDAMAADTLVSRRPAVPVRRAFWLVVVAVGLLAAQTLAAAVLLGRFAGAYTEHAPWSIGEQTQLDSMHTRLALTVVLGAGLALLLTGAATAIPRRHIGTRVVVGFAALLAGVVLLLGVVINPDNALLASGPAEEAHLYEVLPLWFSVLSSTAVTGVLVALVAAFVLLGRDAAHDYYHYHEPQSAWSGFSTWSQVARGR